MIKETTLAHTYISVGQTVTRLIEQTKKERTCILSRR